MDFSELKEHGNKVIAKGRVIGLGRDFYNRAEIHLYLRGVSGREGARISFAYREIDPDIRIGDYVDIEGHYVSFYKRVDNHWNIRRNDREPFSPLISYFVADRITPLKPEIEKLFGVKGGVAYEDGYFKLYYVGHVTRVSITEGQVRRPDGRARNTTFTSFTVRDISERRNGSRARGNYITAQFTSNMKVADNRLNKGDKVVVLASISTKEKKDGKETFYSNSIYVNDLIILEKAHVNVESKDVNEKVKDNYKENTKKDGEKVKGSESKKENPSSPKEEVAANGTSKVDAQIKEEEGMIKTGDSPIDNNVSHEDNVKHDDEESKPVDKNTASSVENMFDQFS